MKTAAVLLMAVLIGACAPIPSNERGLQVGSVISRNLFIDSSQFQNKKIKLRLRNSSGAPELDMTYLRGTIESGLRGAGYEISDERFGIVMDVNAYQLSSVSRNNIRTTPGLGALIGGVAGYEAAKHPGGISAGGGAILGAVAGATLEEIIRSHGEAPRA